LKIVAVLLALAGGLAAWVWFAAKDDTVAKLEVTLYVQDPLLTEGGIVFVIPNRIDAAAFDAGYPVPPDAPDDRRTFSATLSAHVSFVHFDTPGGDYVYRFRVVPGHASGKTVVAEERIGLAGAGNIYMSADTDQPVYAEVSIDHHIFGSEIAKSESLALETSSLDFKVSAAACRLETGVRVCDGDIATLRSLLAAFRSAPEVAN
jgi:hypothetical protein